MSDILLKEEILKNSNSNLASSQLFVLKAVNSTNLYAKQLAKDNCPHFTVIVADSQTEGRGRMGRDFFSPGGTGIYMSIILDCQKIKLPSGLLTVATGVAICNVFKKLLNIDASIKWVNDIYFNNKKVCGILAESLTVPNINPSGFVIIGIGINVSTPSRIFPGKLCEIAGSIFPEHISRNEIIAMVIDELRMMCTKDNVEELIDEYKSRSFILNKKISFTQNGKTFAGIAADINKDGNLIVRLESGKTAILSSGEVSLGSKQFLE